MNTQQLRELAELADKQVTWVLLPRDLDNDGWETDIVNYISAVSPSTITGLVERLEAAERERDELGERFDKLASAVGWSKAQCEQTGESPFDAVEALKNTADDFFNSLKKAEAELARRDAAASEFIYQMRLLDGHENCSDWVEVTAIEYQTPTTDKYGTWERRILYAATPPAVLSQAIGEVRLGDYLDDGSRPATIVCLHDQAGWENFPDGTKLYLSDHSLKLGDFDAISYSRKD